MAVNNEQGRDEQAPPLSSSRRGPVQRGSGQAATVEARAKARPSTIDQLKHHDEHQDGPFQPKPALLIDVAPAAVMADGGPDSDGQSGESAELMLQGLLMTTEALAARAEHACTRWKLLSLAAAILVAPAILAAGWLYREASQLRVINGRARMENQALTEELNTAATQAAGLRGEVEMLKSQNLDLAGQKSLNLEDGQPVGAGAAGASSVVTVDQKAEQPVLQATIPQATTGRIQTFDAVRIEQIRRGNYPAGITRAELTAALGEPDRVYSSRNYEQLVYFGRSPGRFWLVGGQLQQVSR